MLCVVTRDVAVAGGREGEVAVAVGKDRRQIMWNLCFV